MAEGEDRWTSWSSSKERRASKQKEHMGKGKEVKSQILGNSECVSPVWPEFWILDRGMECYYGPGRN